MIRFVSLFLVLLCLSVGQAQLMFSQAGIQASADAERSCCPSPPPPPPDDDPPGPIPDPVRRDL